MLLDKCPCCQGMIFWKVNVEVHGWKWRCRRCTGLWAILYIDCWESIRGQWHIWNRLSLTDIAHCFGFCLTSDFIWGLGLDFCLYVPKIIFGSNWVWAYYHEFCCSNRPFKHYHTTFASSKINWITLLLPCKFYVPYLWCVYLNFASLFLFN